MDKSGVSIIICCYNSSARINKTLKSLSCQETAMDLHWEIILVDNASTDNTKAVATIAWSEFGKANVALRIFDQPVQGLSMARKKGIEESTFNILIFCDDDNALHSNYIESASQIMKMHPQIGALGGQGIMACGIPYWLRGLEEFYAVGPQGNESGDVTDIRGCLYGAGLTIRKTVLDQLEKKQFQSILSDRTKTSLLSGGDTELTFAIRLLGYRLWYDDRLKFEHFISPNRVKKRYFIKLIFFIGYSWMALLPYHQVLNKHKLKRNLPDWIDILYILKKVAQSFSISLIHLIILKHLSSRKKFADTIFHFGELYFALKHYGYYKDLPAFLNEIQS